jgi:hypothetical protein
MDASRIPRTLPTKVKEKKVVNLLEPEERQSVSSDAERRVEATFRKAMREKLACRRSKKVKKKAKEMSKRSVQ